MNQRLTYLLSLLLWCTVAHAAGTVSVCDETHLNTALTGGGAVTFATGSACSITVTGTKTIAATTPIDGTNGGYGTTISGGTSVRIFTVNTGVTLTVQNIALINGNSATSTGGAVSNLGTLIATNTTFSGNVASTFGGAIYSTGTLTLSDCTFTGNIATVNAGGAIYNGGSATISNSTFSGNRSVYGGAIHMAASGGIKNCTFSANTGDSGASNIYRSAGTATLTNTIVANGITTANCLGTITNGGHNIEDGTSCGWASGSGSLSSNAYIRLDPAGLASNGGATQTLAVCTAAGVPASCAGASATINAGDQTVCAASPISNLDQRGYYRPGFGATACSIGAFEASSDVSTPTPTPTNTPTTTPTATPTRTPTATPAMSCPGGSTLVSIPIAAAGDDHLLLSNAGNAVYASQTCDTVDPSSAVKNGAYNSFTGSIYSVGMGEERFDTGSAVPAGNVVVAAQLRHYVWSLTYGDLRNLVTYYYAPGSWPGDCTQWLLSPTGTIANTTAMNSGAQNTTWVSALSPLGQINTGGSPAYTDFRYWIDGGAAANYNTIYWRTYDYGSTIPYLDLCYAAPTPTPTITPTPAPTPTPGGFEYILLVSGTPGAVAVKVPIARFFGRPTPTP